MNHVFHISPSRIERLNEDEIFVFGSNLAGKHARGAANQAMRWGAVWGKGVGLQGQTYAIPTMHGGVDVIKPYVDDFLIFAQQNLQLKFLVTEIGCGIAGFTAAQMAPLFKTVLEQNLTNVYLPLRFYEALML